jgi:rhamnosyltransferase subunit B
MKIYLCPVGSHGDVHPFVGLARTLADRGRDVTVVVSEPFLDLVERCGLKSLMLGTRQEFDELASHPDLWRPLRGPAFVARHGILPGMRRGFDLLKDACEAGDAFLVGSTLGFGFRLLHDVYGTPLVTVHLQPQMFWSEYASPQLSKDVWMQDWMPKWIKRWQFRLGIKFFLDRVLLGDLNQFRGELGLAPVASSTDMFHSPQRVIGMFPGWFSPPQPDWPQQAKLADFPLWDESGVTPIGDELENFLREGEAPIAFTPGSAMVNDTRFFAAAAEACRRLGKRGLLLTRHPAQIPKDLPEGVRHFEYAPFSELLPRCAALVHHGGIGTTAQALAAGIPQLIRPLSHDQPDNVARVKRLGVGDCLWPNQFTGPNAAKILDRLLSSNEVADKCRDVASHFENSDGLSLAADIIEREIETSAKTPLRPGRVRV